jgi:hypothetical protein
LLARHGLEPDGRKLDSRPFREKVAFGVKHLTLRHEG